MKEEIVKICKKLEKENKIKILFAVENGSRAWKMDSKDSDYDVRFVYVKDIKEYIQIKQPRDVIELDKGLIDMVGFDIFKFVKMLASSNPTMIEWLNSDITYYRKQNKVFQKFAEKHYNPKALYFHYKSMCNNNYVKYLKSGNLVTYKKYLYAYRGLVNAKWVINKKTLPPIEFKKAIEGMKNIIPKEITEKLKVIIKLKSKGKEKDRIQNIVKMDNYIEKFLDDKKEILQNKDRNTKMLNEELRKIVIKK